MQGWRVAMVTASDWLRFPVPANCEGFVYTVCVPFVSLNPPAKSQQTCPPSMKTKWRANTVQWEQSDHLDLKEAQSLPNTLHLCLMILGQQRAHLHQNLTFSIPLEFRSLTGGGLISLSRHGEAVLPREHDSNQPVRNLV